MSFTSFPHKTTLVVSQFKARVEDSQLQHFRSLLELSPIGPKTYENSGASGQHGVTREWLEHAKQIWLNNFDWRKTEDRINSYPSFMTSVQDADGNRINLHFLALFSKRADAIPIMLLHGWPSSILDFVDILDLFKDNYTPETLPYHVIVPSLPGYAYSSVLPLDSSYTVKLAASALNNLMVGLGFKSYISQGGDLGSFISRLLATTYDECIGIHLTQMGIPADGKFPDEGLEDVLGALQPLATGFAFLGLQATRPATIGHVLGSSPIALLTWIGEKYLDWTDGEIALEKILDVVTLYWFTDTIQRSMYHNRSLGDLAVQETQSDENVSPKHQQLGAALASIRLPFVSKPCGYSMFPREIIPIPRNWAERSCNLIFCRKHERGGHFAALEQPKKVFDDIEEFVRLIQQI